MKKMINWTPEKLIRFKHAYAEAPKEHPLWDRFTFEGDEFLVAYAKYLIEYLEGRFNENTTR